MTREGDVGIDPRQVSAIGDQAQCVLDADIEGPLFVPQFPAGAELQVPFVGPIGDLPGPVAQGDLDGHQVDVCRLQPLGEFAVKPIARREPAWIEDGRHGDEVRPRPAKAVRRDMDAA